MMRLDKFLAGCRRWAPGRSCKPSMVRAGARSGGWGPGEIAGDKNRGNGTAGDVGRRAGTLPGRMVLMLHKPAGYVTSTEDPRDRTVMELLPEPYKKLVPVGRLDKETEGLLLFTNDGGLAHRLISAPSMGWRRNITRKQTVFWTETMWRRLPPESSCGTGQCVCRRFCGPALGEDMLWSGRGKYHQIRRMLAARGKPVTYLRREREGELRLGDLKKGDCRRLYPGRSGQFAVKIDRNSLIFSSHGQIPQSKIKTFVESDTIQTEFRCDRISPS